MQAQIKTVGRIYFFVVLLLAACSIVTNAQNLLPNPSFERPNYCEANIPCCPAGWYPVSKYPYGYDNDLQKPFDGKHCIAFLIALERSVRCYWQTMLLAALQPGQQYKLSYKLYSPNIEFIPAYMGAHFSDTLYRSVHDILLQPSPNLVADGKDIQPLKKGWFRVALSFTATGNEKYLLLGNLSKTSNQDILADAGKRKKYIEYYIDDISLEAAGGQESNCAGCAAREDSLYAANNRHGVSPFQQTLPQTTSAPVPIVSTPGTYPVFIPKTDTILLGRINFNFNSDKLLNPFFIDNISKRMEQIILMLSV